MPEINYENLITEYNESIANVLRGFRPKYDFLESWVPDANHNRSIVNLVESAQSFGVAQIKLKVTRATLTQIDLPALKGVLESMGRLEVVGEGDQTLFLVTGLVEEPEGDRKVAGSASKVAIPERYRQNLQDLLNDIHHETTLVDNDILLLIRSTTQGISLFTGIDRESHVIRKAAFAGTSNDLEKGLLEGLCRIIENTPIQDASDHGVIKLEWLLRDHLQPNPVAGISNVFNFDPIFKMPMDLIRQLHAKYCQETGFKETKNFWDGTISSNWRLASDDDRLKRLQVAIDQHPDQERLNAAKVKVTGVDRMIKVSLLVEGDIPPFEKAKLILSLEKYLRHAVEPKLQIYQEMRKDLNKTRRL